MQPLTNKSKQVVKQELTFAEKIYLPAILNGMKITLKHFFKKKVTISYPEQKKDVAPVWRGQHILKRDENGAERCTACGLCALACPAEAITMVAAERQKGEEKYTGKKSMQLPMRSICCVVFFVDYVKRPVLKKQFFLLINW